MKFNDYRLKILLAEFDDYLAVVEFPVNDTVVRSIIDKAHAEFPNKPIRYVFHTHHHQHAASGFDSFLKQTDACLVTSSYNYEKIKSLTKDTFKLQERYIRNDSVYRVKAGGNELVCEVIKNSEYAVPTQEYNLIYFPTQGVVVSGCLYQKPFDYHQVVNDRKLALKNIVEAKEINARLLIPTNTCKESGFEDICTIAMLDSTLKYGIKPAEVADFFQAKSLEYLNNLQDSIKRAIQEIPNYYDYYQCAKVLMKRKDYDRALIIFQLIPEIYTDFSHNVFLYSGDCYKHKDDKDLAKIFYGKYIDCAMADIELQWGNERIKQLEIKSN